MLQESKKVFTGAVDLEFSISISGIFTSALINFDTAPTTSENLTITFKSGTDSNLDTALLTTDPSTDSTRDIFFHLDNGIPLNKGDKISVEYTNTDARTIGVTIKGADRF